MIRENRRSREAVRNGVRTYGVKVMDPASLPLKKTKERESQESMSRYSEKSLHSQYKIRQGFWKTLVHSTPYATLLATLLCLLGLVLFSTGRQRGVAVTNSMITEVLKNDDSRVPAFDIIFLVLEITTIILGIMILIIGILATGDTRAKVYGGWKARASGNVCCAVFIVITFIFFCMWLLVSYLFSMLVFVILISKMSCDSVYSNKQKECLNVPVANIFLWNYTDITVCEDNLMKKYCKDFVEKATAAYITASLGNTIILMSLVMFLMCLAINYTRIRFQSKFKELEEMHHIDAELHNSKDRF